MFVVESQGNHGPEPAHLTCSYVVSWMTGQAWVEHLCYCGVLCEVVRECFGVVAVAVHAHSQRFNATGDEVGVESRGDGAGAALEEGDGLVDFCVVGYYYPADYV